MSTSLLVISIFMLAAGLWWMTTRGSPKKPGEPWKKMEPKQPTINSPSAANPQGAAQHALQEHRRMVKKLMQSQRTGIHESNTTPLPTGFKPVVQVETDSGQKYTVSLRFSGSVPNAPAQEIDKDAWEGQYLEDYAPGMTERRLDGVNLNIKFVDREGAATQRNITVKRYAHNPKTRGGVIYAFCHLRQGNRPFAFQRIRQATDLATGEIIQNIGEFLDIAYQASPLYSVEQFLAEHEAAVVVLFSFAKADGAMRAKERVLIAQWAALNGLIEQQDLLALEGVIKSWYFNKNSFYDAVKTLTQQARPDQYMQTLWTTAQAILASDKKQHSDEAQLLSYAARQWGIKLPKEKTQSSKPI